MGAPLTICRQRGVVAVLASGVVISLTALTGGIAPAFAKPDTDPVSPTTVVAPVPEVTVPEPEQGNPRKVAEAPAPAAPQEPATQPAVEVPQIQAPEPPEVVEPAPQTKASQAPVTTIAPPVTEIETAEPEPTTAQRTPEAPSTASAPSTAVAPSASAAPSTAAAPSAAEAPSPAEAPSAAEAPSTTAAPATASDSPQPSTNTPSGAPESSEAPTPSDDATPTSAAAPPETDKGGDESETPTVSITQAAKEIETVEPQTLEAPEADVQLAKAAKPVVEQQPAPAAERDLASLTNEIETGLKIPGLEIETSAKTDLAVERRDVELVSRVRQWRPDWIEYDEYYRPIILNPYRAPVRIVYIYDRAPRIVYVPPLARIVLEAVQFAAYSFTAAVLAPINAAIDTMQAVTDIAVGTFLGGGYYPGVGLPLPAPPPPVLRYDNVPVFVNYSNAAYEPFRVRQIVDVGHDARYGERQVLLDGATPAWGVWTQTPTGERQFEVHRTQQFPGLGEPAEAPLPGDYKLRLLSDEQPSSGFTGRDIFLFVTAGVIGTLGFGAIGLAFFLGRRRPQL